MTTTTPVAAGKRPAAAAKTPAAKTAAAAQQGPFAGFDAAGQLIWRARVAASPVPAFFDWAALDAELAAAIDQQASECHAEIRADHERARAAVHAGRPLPAPPLAGCGDLAPVTDAANVFLLSLDDATEAHLAAFQAAHDEQDEPGRDGWRLHGRPDTVPGFPAIAQDWGAELADAPGRVEPAPAPGPVTPEDADLDDPALDQLREEC